MACDSDFRIAILKPIRYEPTGALTVRLLLTVTGTGVIESMSCAIEGSYQGWTITAAVPEGRDAFLKTVNHKFLNLDQVRAVYCEQPAVWVEEFQFCFPARSHPLGDTPPSITTVPPLCSCHSKRSVSPRGSGGRIRYMLKAALWSTDRIMASCTEEITLKPCYLPSPPMCLQDFPRDYRAKHSKKLHNLFGKVSRSLELSFGEPNPLQYCQQTRRLHTTLTFKAKCEDIIHRQGEFLKPVTGTFQIQLALRSKTLTSRSQLKTQPTSAQIRHIPWITETVQEYPSKSWTLNIPAWKTETYPNLLGNIECKVQDHVTSFSVDFWQKGCSCLVPTFSTPFIQRRYSIKATITFRNTTNHDFHLEIPVQVCTGADWEAVTPAYTEGMDSNFSSGIAEEELSERRPETDELPHYLPRESWDAV
ncbi:hypothetical protein IFR04_002617 [Cadophora malorum]|uniref:Uncharacterized protein n=1 Tax=Cadophora malorum TaxID=108018 RepID=A0A8H7WFZ3_9HELO|nr:hypothetical protein IFR04_002617 [Cadophora malorum]